MYGGYGSSKNEHTVYKTLTKKKKKSIWAVQNKF